MDSSVKSVDAAPPSAASPARRQRNLVKHDVGTSFSSTTSVAATLLNGCSDLGPFPPFGESANMEAMREW